MKIEKVDPHFHNGRVSSRTSCVVHNDHLHKLQVQLFMATDLVEPSRVHHNQWSALHHWLLMYTPSTTAIEKPPIFHSSSVCENVYKDVVGCS